MRMTGVATPFRSFTIPPSAPEPVAEAWKEFNRIGILYDDASDDLKSAQQPSSMLRQREGDRPGHERGRGAGRPAEARARGAGRDRASPDSQAGSERRQTRAGNTLAKQIAQHKDEWQAATRLVDLLRGHPVQVPRPADSTSCSGSSADEVWWPPQTSRDVLTGTSEWSALATGVSMEGGMGKLDQPSATGLVRPYRARNVEDVLRCLT